MPTEKKPSQRDLTLIKVLERLSDQLRAYETRLEEVEKNQADILELVRRSEQRQDSRMDMSEKALEKFKDSMLRYRSDMLSIVNEQDRMSDALKELTKRQGMIAASQEEIGKDLSDLDGRFAVQEKHVREHYDYTLKLGGAFASGLADTNRNSAKLHADTEKQLGDEHREIKKQLADADHKTIKLHEDTEKRLGEAQRETVRQITELRQEMKRRLLSLDGIEATLQVLMVRTEPPEKRPFIAIRVARGVGGFFRYRIPEFFRRVGTRLRK